MSSSEEVPQIDEFAMVFILNIDHTPSILTAADLLAIHDDRLLAADNCEGNDLFDGRIGGALLIIQLIVVVWVHLEVMECKLLLYSLLEGTTLLERKGVGLSNDRHDVDDVRQLLENNYIDGLESMSRWLDEEEAAVDSGVLDVSLSLGGELLAEIGRVLVLDVLDDRVPAAVNQRWNVLVDEVYSPSVIVDLVTITWCIHDIESQSNAVLLNDCIYGQN